MKTVLVGLAATLLVSGAYAASSGQSAGAAPAPTRSDAQHAAAVEKHIKDLHSQLGITAAEEVQWAEVALTMQESATELYRAIDKCAAAAGNDTAIDNLNAYGNIAQARVDSVK